MSAQVDIRELLPLHALGALDGDEAARVDAAVAADPALRAELDGYLDVTGELPIGLEPIEPSPSVRDRLMNSVDATVAPSRWERFAARVAEMYDVTLDKARMFLSWIDDPSKWEDSDWPSVRVVHLPVGGQWAGADCGLVRMPPGHHFPFHVHLGDELTLVLSGRVKDSTGAEYGPGDEQVLTEDDEHDFVVDPASGEYIFALRFHGIAAKQRPR